MKRLISSVFNFILISFSLLIILLSLIVYNKLNSLEKLKLTPLVNISTTSYIYSKDDILIKEINDNFEYYVTYNELSDDLLTL